jgi:hypothetical protein
MRSWRPLPPRTPLRNTHTHTHTHTHTMNNKYYEGDKSNAMDWECSTHWSDEKCVQLFLLENLNGNLRVDVLVSNDDIIICNSVR